MARSGVGGWGWGGHAAVPWKKKKFYMSSVEKWFGTLSTKERMTYNKTRKAWLLAEGKDPRSANQVNN